MSDEKLNEQAEAAELIELLRGLSEKQQAGILLCIEGLKMLNEKTAIIRRHS